MDFKRYVSGILSPLCDIDEDKVFSLLEKPKDEALGDIAFPCFTLAKVLRKAPPQIASSLSEKISPDSVIKSVSPAGGYLNFFFERSAFAENVIEKISSEGEDYGKSNEGEGKTVIVEFSSPNIAKPFHIGHLFSTAVGNSLSKIYAFLGYKVERINHLGDWGTQFGKLICAYKKWGDKEATEKTPMAELTRIYVKFHEEAKNDPALEDEARHEFHLLEEGDEENHKLWSWFRQVSLDEFMRVYDQMGVGFDSFNGEAFYQDKMDKVVDELEDKNLLTLSDGAKIVEFDNMPPAIIIKKDGSTIYATRDLAAAVYRAETYHFYKNIYVVGIPQTLHFNQLFEILRKMGKPYADDCVHVGFGTVKFADGAMSTRTGNVVLLETVLSEAVKKTGEIMKANGNLGDDYEDSAKKVGIGAIFYTFLKNSREKDIIFDWNDILDFNGESGPYVQYSFARGSSILKRESAPDKKIDFDYDITDEEYTLIKLLSAFPESVKAAADKNEPFYITRYVTNLSKAFNKFYNTAPILKAEDKVKAARLKITESALICIKNALSLLGIETVERM